MLSTFEENIIEKFSGHPELASYDHIYTDFEDCFNKFISNYTKL